LFVYLTPKTKNQQGELHLAGEAVVYALCFALFSYQQRILLGKIEIIGG
jgi:hypothetical protein